MRQWSMYRGLEHSPASTTSLGRVLSLSYAPVPQAGSPHPAASLHSRGDQSQGQREASLPQPPSTLEGHVHSPQLLEQGKVACPTVKRPVGTLAYPPSGQFPFHTCPCLGYLVAKGLFNLYKE